MATERRLSRRAKYCWRFVAWTLVTMEGSAEHGKKKMEMPERDTQEAPGAYPCIHVHPCAWMRIHARGGNAHKRPRGHGQRPA